MEPLHRSCHTTQDVGKPNQTVKNTTGTSATHYKTQYRFECNGEWKKKSIVREAILKFSANSEQKTKIESAPKTTAQKREPKYETKPKETKVNQTQIQPNPCYPPVPKAPVTNNPHPQEPNDPLGQTKPVKIQQDQDRVPKEVKVRNYQPKPTPPETSENPPEGPQKPASPPKTMKLNIHGGSKSVKRGGNPCTN